MSGHSKWAQIKRQKGAEDAKKSLKIDWKMPDKLVQQADVDKLVKVGIGKDVKIQKEGNTAAAAAMMVWHNSLRAGSTPEIRVNGREMWAQLERG